MKLYKVYILLTVTAIISCKKSYEPIYQEDYSFYHPEFTDSENEKMNDLIKNIPNDTKTEYSKKYRTWRETWDWEKFAVCSNPRCWTQSQQYVTLLSFCKNEGKIIWPLAFRSYVIAEREYLGALLIEDLTLPDYNYIINEIHEMIQSNAEKKYSNFLIYYIKEILKDL